MAIFLTLFGRPQIEIDGSAIDLPFERRHQLLSYLALQPGWVGRTELATLLWPGQAARLAHANLRKALFRIQTLPWAAAIEIQAHAVQCVIDSDVRAFGRALAERRLGDALTFEAADLLAGFDDGSGEAWSEWLHYQRDHLRAAWRNTAIDHLAGMADGDAAIALSARLLAADPIDEDALRLRIGWLARGGHHATARREYRDFVARLSQQFGLAPGAELQAQAAALDAPSPAPSAPVTAHPDDDDGFVGRTAELALLADWLDRAGAPLLTLTGQGGVGKTRLAQRLLRDNAGRFRHGAVAVLLADTVAPDQLASRLALDLGLKVVGSAPVLDQVIDHLREREMLLLLDNFEHIVAAAHVVEQLARACPRLRLLVTSRTRLAIPAESLLPIDGLPCPEPEDSDRIELFDAARLFVRRARRVQPELPLKEESAAIVQICRQVEGLPLALELAAGWTRLLSCRDIARELGESTRLLSAADAAQPPRHASIALVFEQSWQLLTLAERQALVALSVFRGGFSAEAARTVAGASLPVLGALVDKSLLRKDGDRLVQHPVVHRLAALRLGPAEAATRRAHAHFFRNLGLQHRRALTLGDRHALALFETEFENVRAAWAWATEAAEPQTLGALLMPLQLFCDRRGRYDEALRMVMAAVEAGVTRADGQVEAAMLSIVAHFEYRLDRYADAMATAAHALDQPGASGAQDTRLQCLRVQGACSLRLARYDDARQFYAKAIRLAAGTTDPRNAAAMMDNLALVEKLSGRLDQALAMSLQALEEFRRIGDASSEALCLNNLGDLQVERGALDSARLHLDAAMALCERHGLEGTRALVLANCAEVAIQQDDVERAMPLADKALAASLAIGNRGAEAWVRLELVRIALARSDLARARAELRPAMELAIDMARPASQLAAVAVFGAVLAAQGANEGARAVLGFVLAAPAASVSERRLAARVLDQLPAGEAPPWPGMSLAELAHRIAIETPLAHRPLVADLCTASPGPGPETACAGPAPSLPRPGPPGSGPSAVSSH